MENMTFLSRFNPLIINGYLGTTCCVDTVRHAYFSYPKVQQRQGLNQTKKPPIYFSE